MSAPRVQPSNYGLGVTITDELWADGEPYRETVRLLAEEHRKQLDRLIDEYFKEPIKVPIKPSGWALIAGCEVIAETAAALRVRVHAIPPDRSAVDAWVPKSLLHKTENEIKRRGDTGFLVIPEWLAREKRML